jgi:exonuclease VII large subunit
MQIRTLIAGLTACAALAAPAAASAQKPLPTFHRTFPVASGLCAHAAAGKLPKKLQASADQVNQACNTLQAAFTQAQSDLQAAVTPLEQQLTDAVNQAKTACQQARQTHDRAACKQALADARTTAAGLKGQLKTAFANYRNAANAARKAFWTTIRSLRGGASIKPDGPVPPQGS